MSTTGADPLHARDKLVRATAELLRERAMRVTTRDIADRAGVQTSLIHRHFGGKDGLVQAVLVEASDGYASTVGDADSARVGFEHAFEYLTGHPAAIFAFALGTPSNEGHGFPGVALHIDQLRRESPSDGRDPRVLAVAALALMAGWVGIEPFVRDAAGLDDLSIDDLRAEIEEILLAMVGREQSSAV
jgi:AcrR family transcriptional regulator